MGLKPIHGLLTNGAKPMYDIPTLCSYPEKVFCVFIRLMTPCWIKFVYKRLKINMYKLCPYYILLSVSEILWKTQFHERSLWRHIEDQSHIQLKTNGTKDNQIYWHYQNTRNTCLKKIRHTFTLVIIEDRTKQCASKKTNKRMLYTFYMTFTSIQIIWKKKFSFNSRLWRRATQKQKSVFGTVWCGEAHIKSSQDNGKLYQVIVQ